MSLRTIQRHSDNDLPDSAVSEHAILIAELITDVVEVFGSPESVQNWLHSPLVGLGGTEPISLLDTGFDIRLVREETGRLEKGVYS